MGKEDGAENRDLETGARGRRQEASVKTQEEASAAEKTDWAGATARSRHRGPESRGPESRGPESRGPESREPESREPESRGRARGRSRSAELRDEVDDLVSAWETVRPDLDAAPLHILSRVSRLARHLDRARRAACASHGLETWEFDVLSALRRQGAPYQLSPGALLRTTLVTSGTMTNRVDRLAHAGLVRRLPDPQDKRGVLVALTDAGRARVDSALADLLDAEQALLHPLPADRRRALAGLLRTLLAPLDAE